MQGAKKSLILGGAGALGKAMVTTFKNKGWGVASLDLVKNTSADANILLDPSKQIQSQLSNLYNDV